MRNRANIFDLYREVKLKESEILERTLTDAEKEKLKKLEKEVPMKDFKDRYGKEGESVYYATLTKMAKDEGFASDAQRRAAFAQGYKAKGKKGKKEETELDEAKFQVNYSKGGKLFSKTINAKDEDDVEDKAIKKFKIDDDDIRSVVKEKLVGGQKKLDKDKDGDIDGKDFAILRKQKKKVIKHLYLLEKNMMSQQKNLSVDKKNLTRIKMVI